MLVIGRATSYVSRNHAAMISSVSRSYKAKLLSGMANELSKATSNLKPYLSGRHVEYSGFREYVIENLGNCLGYTRIPDDTPREGRHMATCN